MRADEYDALIADPTAFLYNVWLPRVSTEVSPPGAPATYRHNLSFVKGAMAMLSYFYAFGPAIARLRTESGTVSAIAGIFALFDIPPSKLRGYVGLTMDMHPTPKRHLQVARGAHAAFCHGSDHHRPARRVPIISGCTAAACRSSRTFASHNWRRPIIEEFGGRAPDALLRRGQGITTSTFPRAAGSQHCLL